MADDDSSGASSCASACCRCAFASDRTSISSPCYYASTVSRSVPVIHQFCGSSGNQYYCCPTERDGRATACITKTRCDYEDSGMSIFAIIFPLLLVGAIIACVLSFVRRRQQMQQPYPMGPPGAYGQQPQYGPGGVPYGQPVYGQQGQQQGGMGAGGAAALGAGAGFFGGFMLANAFDGRDYGGGGYGGGGGGGGDGFMADVGMGDGGGGDF
mmetsp:Transcript_27/g.29  ORF Transcript_27/g.29 Transcript_27/m.29 type:complete len:212 (+) Transcript_27:149-784(+)